MLSTVALAISTMAIALFSCSVTNALLPSGETAMYSGSTSSAIVASGKILTPAARKSSSWPTKLEKLAITTFSWLKVSKSPETSIMPTEPSGSITVTVPSSATSTFASPSFATSTLLPSGVKVTISGSAPTVKTFNASLISPPAAAISTAASKSTSATTPGSVAVSASSATANKPLL